MDRYPIKITLPTSTSFDEAKKLAEKQAWEEVKRQGKNSLADLTLLSSSPIREHDGYSLFVGSYLA